MNGDKSFRALVVLSVAVALAVPVVSFACIFPLVDNMPTWDQWSLVELWMAHYEGRPVLPLMLKPYNGHLNLVPRLIFYGMGVLSHWDVRLDIVASYVAACGTLALLLLMARRSRQGLLMAAPISAQVFSFLQYENFFSGYPFGQNLSQFLSTLAVFLLSLPLLGRRAFAGAAVATAAATFSWGAGLAGWYVGLVALLLRPDRSRRRLGVWAALTLLSTVAVKMGAGASFRPIDWKQLAPFFLALLGKAWTPVASPSVRLVVYLGAGAFVAFAAVTGWVLFRRRLWPEGLPWLLLGLSALASAGLIAIGRSGEVIDQALASHYVTATYPLIVAGLGLLFLALRDAAESTRLKPLWQGLALVAVALPFLQAVAVSRPWLPVLRSWSTTIHHNAIEIARGTATDEAIRTSHHPDPRFVREGVEVLRRYRLSWFHEALDGEAPAGNVDRLAGQAVRSPVAVEVSQPWTIEGWAVRSRRFGGEVKAVHLFVDGRRVASAQLSLPRTDVVSFFHSPEYLGSGWVISVPASAVAPGTHRLWVAAADYNDGLFSLLETDLVATGGSVRPAGEQRELGSEVRQKAPLPAQHAAGKPS